MNDISLTILPETPEDAAAIDRLHERTFGPGRFAKTAYRLREQAAHRLDVSFTARIGTLLVGSVWLSPVRIGETKALLLGPLTVEPAFREQGVGQALIERALARSQGQRPPPGHSGRRRAVLRKMRVQARAARPRHHARAGRSGAASGRRTRGGRLRRRFGTDPAGLKVYYRPSRAQAPARLPSRSNRPIMPANTGSTPMPRTTLTSRIFSPIQSSPL